MTVNSTEIKSRIIGIDFGSKRIGIAMSDELGSLAFPLTVISGFGHSVEKKDSKKEQVEKDILDILKDKGVKTVVIGRSVNLKGEDNAIMEDAKYLGERLGSHDYIVIYEPEMFSTIQARMFQSENKQVDASAAAIILQSYLDRIKFKNMNIQTELDKKEENDKEVGVNQDTKSEQKEEQETPVYINIDDFMKVEMRIGQILSAERIEGSDKLLKLAVDFGEELPRQVLSGIAKMVEIEDIVGKKFPFVTNLAPRKMMGMESQAMILAGSSGDDLALLNPSKDLPNGTKLK
jgi:putative transcription antitermination factor YqgF